LTFALVKMPHTQKHQFVAAATRQGTEVVLVLSGYIWPDNSNASAAIAAQLATLQEGDQLTVMVRNLYGGDTDEGMTIYHDLLTYKPKVKVDGVVASMGFAIMLAGTEIEISSHSKGMMHRPTGGCIGDFEDMRERADRNEQIYNELADLIAARTGMTADLVKATLMPKGKDVWLTPAKMVEMKLADRVTTGSLLRSTVAMKDLRKLTDADDILGKFQACLDEDELPTSQTEAPMNKELLKTLGLPESATQEQYDAAVAERIKKGDAASVRLADVERDQAAAQEKELDELLDNGVKSNVLTIARRDELKAQAKGNVAVVLPIVKSLVQDMQPHRSATEQIRGTPDSATAKKMADRAEWDYKQWAEKDPTGLAQMQQKDNAAFEALKKAYVDNLRSAR
jgi:ATP-dependent protease ClpP protease subunit